jgi:hypothetical protein
VKSYLLELPDDYLPEQCNKIKSVTAGHFKKYTNEIKKKEEKVKDMTIANQTRRRTTTTRAS